MGSTWARFLILLDESLDLDAVVQFECRGAFLKFRSRLVRFDRPVTCSVENLRLFGVVPQHVTLIFANGVRINLYMRHVDAISDRDDGVVVSFRGDGGSRNSVAFLPRRMRKDFAG